MQKFELLGADGDETRLLHAPACGYSIALAGRPSVVPVPAGPTMYDVVIALGDVPAHHGFRIDELPTQVEPSALAIALLGTYRNNRAGKQEAQIKPLPIAATWRLAGGHAIYPLRDQPEPTMEQAWLDLRAGPAGYSALFHTTWFESAAVNHLAWGHLRASFIDQHAWDGKPRDPSPTIWPFSAITLRSARLDLTARAWEMAAGKAGDLGQLPTEQTLAVLDYLRCFVTADDSPRAPLDPALRNQIWGRIMELLPQRAAIGLLVGLDDCTTRHDLRGWVWQQVWAMGNRG